MPRAKSKNKPKALRTLLLLAVLTPITYLSACSPKANPNFDQTALMQRETSAINDWFEARFQDELERSPMSKTYLGLEGGEDRLDDMSQQAADEEAALLRGWKQDMAANFDVDRLDPQARMSYELFNYDVDDRLRAYDYSDHYYVFEHMTGPHSNFPSFMINIHKIDDLTDAQGFISRIKASETYLGQYAARAEAQAEKGVLLPAYIYPRLIKACRNIISGQPFEGGGANPLLSSFETKLEALELDRATKDDLISQARAALRQNLGPAYLDLIAMFERHQLLSDDRHGVWKLPNGEAYYQARLSHYTTTNMTADEIHQIGLKEVERIHSEMRKIQQDIEFKGSLQDFFDFLRSDPQFTYSNDEAGRQRYIREATAHIDLMRERLDDLFITKPKADMVVKAVEKFREDTSFGAFYSDPALDGSRPGTYYINLKDMDELAIYQQQALAYHEGIPGHHMQIALAQELQGLPRFRTLGSHTAYVEGWALYSESVPAELGLYTDPYQDFGRLSMEIFRAARLVVDTGIHAKKWTRQEAVDYMLKNTANTAGDIVAEIDRYIVWPGQATAYKIGMLKIMELRARANEALGKDFDIREFHDLILANGSVPMTILEQNVNRWIKAKQ